MKIDYRQLLKPVSITNPRNKFVSNLKPQFNKKIIDINLCQLGKDVKDKNTRANDLNDKLSNLGSNFSILSGSSVKSGNLKSAIKLSENVELANKRSKSSENLKDYIGSMIRKKSARKNISSKELKESNLPSLPNSAKSSIIGSVLKYDFDQLTSEKN